MRTVALCLLVLLSACRAPEPRAATPPRMRLVLLAGQSNMAGRGVVAAEDRVPNARVLMLDSAGHWVPAVEPVHFDKPIAGVGPGRSFALALASREPTAVVGLVPTAVGGSSITSWVPGGYDSATRTHPYDDAVRRIRLARSAGAFVAILWHQGESDSSERGAAEHEARLRELIERLRAEAGAPDAPFLIGQLGVFAERPWTPWRAAIDSVHRRVAASVPNAAFVSASGLAHKGDTLHFSADAARELGRRYFAAYATLRP
jgi:hypothetical protein